MPYVRELTGLRGWAALWVVFFHLQYGFNFSPDFYFLLFPGRLVQKGYLAVDIFFILSGYVMALTCSSWDGGKPLEFFKSFIWRRLARIYPLHILSLFLMVALAVFSAKNFLWDEWGRSLLAHLSLTHAWGQLYMPDWNYPSWSISAEWAAYLSFPVLFLLNRKISKSSYGIFAAIILPMGVLIWSAYALREGSMDMTWDLGWYRCLMEFWIGLTLWHLFQIVRAPLKDRLRPWLAVLSGVSLGMFLLFPFTSPLPDAGIIPISTLLVFSIALGSRFWERVLANRFSYYLGEISYSIYMLHVPVGLSFLKLWNHQFGELQPALSGAVALLITLLILFAVSTLTHNYFEKPVRQWLTRSRKSSRLSSGKRESP
ncbi:MAG: acyltransferase family protein [Pseudobdellovibrionaceae bacterium]